MTGIKEPGVRIHREWYELTKPLMDRDESKWGKFFLDVIAYALGETERPSFVHDAELQDLWEKTNVKPCDLITGKKGKLTVWKRKLKK